MHLIKKIIQVAALAMIAIIAGLILQCASDPAFTGDGGVVDTMLAEVGLHDSIGPKADAAGGGLSRTVYKGKTDGNGDFNVCNSAWKTDDPPLVMLWLSGDQGLSYVNGAKLYNLRIAKGCMEFNGSLYDKNMYYRLVVVH